MGSCTVSRGACWKDHVLVVAYLGAGRGGLEAREVGILFGMNIACGGNATMAL